MLKIPDPAMCLNAEDMYPSMMDYKMWNTRKVTKDISARWLAENTASVAAGAPGGKLAALIINCHGLVTPENEFVGLAIGKEIHFKDLGHFSKLKPFVEKIYMTVCGAARGESGKSFCKEMAYVSGATVIAGEWDQTLPISVAVKLPGGMIDNFEGPMYQFLPSREVQPFP